MAFLGHIITQESVSVDPAKIKAMLKLLVVLRSEAFFGLKGCYRRFIEELSIVTQLTKLTRKGIPFRWSDDYECCFRELKRRLTIAPVLTLPLGSGGYVIYSDVSIGGSDYVLM